MAESRGAALRRRFGGRGGRAVRKADEPSPAGLVGVARLVDRGE
jgi:hypothetical protein